MILKFILGCAIFAFGWFCASMFKHGEDADEAMSNAFDEHQRKNN